MWNVYKEFQPSKKDIIKCLPRYSRILMWFSVVFSGHSPVDGRGGQLQIAGVVVGNWGANTHGGGNRGGRQSNIGPPQVTSVGPRR